MAQSNTVVNMYALKHPDYVGERWHVFVTYIIVTWLACATVCLFNKAMPYLNQIGIFFILAGFLITIIVV
jgi:choline transport protein